MSGYMPTGPPSDEQVARALKIAREQGWLTDDGFVWEREPENPDEIVEPKP